MLYLRKKYVIRNELTEICVCEFISSLFIQHVNNFVNILAIKTIHKLITTKINSETNVMQ